MNRKKIQNIFLIVIFSLIIGLPTLDSIFNFSPIKELFEKRILANKPEFPTSIAELKAFPKKIDDFFNDNYGLRKTLIFLNTKILDNIFDQSPDSSAVIGKEGWLYFDNQNSILDAIGKAKLRDELIDKAVQSFAKNWQELRKDNIDYLLVIAADKSSIYPEFLPDYMKPSLENNHRSDKFISALKKKYPDFPILDLRPILKKAKEKEVIYHKTDTHWNKVGAHYGYIEIINFLAKKNPILKPYLRKNFIENSSKNIRGDISDIMNIDEKNVDYDLQPKFKPSSYLQIISKEESLQFYKPTFFANNNKNLPIIFVYKDSFFDNLADFISWHFSYSYYVHEFPCDLNLKVVKKYHPNVVIQEFWEGRIQEVFNKCLEGLS